MQQSPQGRIALGGLLMGTIGIGDILYRNDIIGNVSADKGTHAVDQLIVIFFTAMIFIPVYVGNGIKDNMKMRIWGVLMLCYDYLINSSDIFAYVLCD